MDAFLRVKMHTDAVPNPAEKLMALPEILSWVKRRVKGDGRETEGQGSREGAGEGMTLSQTIKGATTRGVGGSGPHPQSWTDHPQRFT